MNETELDSQTGSTLLDYFKIIPGIITAATNRPTARIADTGITAAAPATNWKPFAYIGGAIVLVIVLLFALKK